MIIQIRGTSGSGKTTVAREVFSRLKAQYGAAREIFTAGRRKPLYSLYGHRVAVVGHYESACGGCDNIGSAREVYDTILLIRKKHPDTLKCIVSEGLLLSEDTKWTIQLASEIPLKVLYLTTDIEECLRRIRKRREEAGNDKPLNEKNSRNRVRTIDRSRNKLIDAGILCRRSSSSQAARIVLEWIREVA